MGFKQYKQLQNTAEVAYLRETSEVGPQQQLKEIPVECECD